MATETETIKQKLTSAKSERERIGICANAIKDALDDAYIPQFAKSTGSLGKYGDARFALGYLKALASSNQS